MRVVHRAVGRFCYDFLVGDDWKITAAAVGTLVCGAVVLLGFGPVEPVFTVVLALTQMAAFLVAVLVDVRPADRPSTVDRRPATGDTASRSHGPHIGHALCYARFAPAGRRGSRDVGRAGQASVAGVGRVRPDSAR